VVFTRRLIGLIVNWAWRHVRVYIHSRYRDRNTGSRFYFLSSAGSEPKSPAQQFYQYTSTVQKPQLKGLRDTLFIYLFI